MFTVLAVTNEEIPQKYIAAALHGSDYKIVPCESGIVALEAVQIKPFDLIIIAEKMPYMDGVKTVRQIRRVRGFDSCPVLFMLNDMSDMNIDNLTSLGVAGFVKMPLNVNEIERTAKFILTHWKSQKNNLKNYADYKAKSKEILEKSADSFTQFVEKSMDSDLMDEISKMMKGMNDEK